MPIFTIILLVLVNAAVVAGVIKLIVDYCKNEALTAGSQPKKVRAVSATEMKTQVEAIHRAYEMDDVKPQGGH